MPDNQSKGPISGEVFQAPQTVEEPHESDDSPTPELKVEEYQPPPADFNESTAVPPPASRRSNIKAIIFGVLGIIIVIAIALFVSKYLRGGSSGGGQEAVSLTYWGLWESEAVMKTVIDDFQKQHKNITVSYEMQSQTQYRERLQAAIERGEGPDVFRFHATWYPMLKGQLAPIPSSAFSAGEIETIFYPAVRKDLVHDGNLYGVPIMIDGLMLFYNKDMLQSIGKEPPESWADFEDLSSRLTEKDENGNMLQAGAAIGTADNIEHFSDLLGLIMYQNGVDFSALSSKKAEESLTYYALFAQEPYNVWDNEQDNSIIAFAGGKVAMIFAPSWQVFTLKAINPSLNFGTAPVPQLIGAEKVAWSTYWAEGINARSPNKQAAAEFLTYLSEKEVMTKLFSEATKQDNRAFGEPYSRTDLSEEMKASEYIKPLAEQAPIMKSWYLSSRTKDNGINDKIIEYFKDAVNAVYQGSSPQGALSTAAQGVNQILTEYGAQ